jgi:CDP-paratose 2-epimerase|tara:strand:- start:2468 stop:3517 length:1050 start_codon:yes stop_codon:yes gene_type:complete
MSIALITGSCGLVGSESAYFFSSKGLDVVGIDNNLRQIFFGKEASTIWQRNKLKNKLKTYNHFNTDIRNYNNLEKIFKKFKKNISVVIHCAAQPSHDYGKNFPVLDFDVNAKGTLNMLELTKIYCPNSVFINMSTNKVYGDNPNRLNIIEKSKRWELKKNDLNYKGIKENFSLDNCTHSFFGVSKVYSDLIAQEYGKNIGLKTVSFRGGCITGPNHSGAKLHGFLSYLVKAGVKNKKYSLIGYKGKQVRDNLHSYDLVNCFWEVFKKPKKGEVYNIGGGRYSNCSVIEALESVEKISKIKIKKEYVKSNRVGDHIWYVSDISKFKKDYPNWKQHYNTNKILEELVESYK